MNNFFDKFSNGLMKAATIVNNNVHLSVMKNTFITIMPFTITASFATLFSVIISNETTGLARFSFFSFLTLFGPLFSAISFAGLNLMAILVAYLMGQYYGEKEKISPKITGLLGLVSYITLSPTDVTSIVDSSEVTVNNVLSTSVTGAQGLFLAMIVSMFSSMIFLKFMKIQKLKIKLPDQVPSNISESFNTIFPVMMVLFVMGIVRIAVFNFTDSFLNDLVYTIIQIPLQNVANTTWGVVLITFMSLIFWVVGIHGNQVISPIRSPLTAVAMAANISAVAEGMVPQNPFTMTFWFSFVTLGGSGITLSLLIAIWFFSKRADYKEITKLSFIPSVFGINEPVIFGLPIVLNPIMILPFVISGCLGALVGMVSHTIGFLVPSAIEIPFGLPIFVSGFVGYGLKGILVQILILVLSFFVYLPFVFISNKQVVQNSK